MGSLTCKPTFRVGAAGSVMPPHCQQLARFTTPWSIRSRRTSASSSPPYAPHDASRGLAYSWRQPCLYYTRVLYTLSKPVVLIVAAVGDPWGQNNLFRTLSSWKPSDATSKMLFKSTALGFHPMLQLSFDGRNLRRRSVHDIGYQDMAQDAQRAPPSTAWHTSGTA